MTIEAKVIEDSISEAGISLTTFQVKYQRFIHSELMTHRTKSRNASSSRAIPVKKALEAIRNDPAMPVHWGLNEKGMQANTEADAELIAQGQALWKAASESACRFAENMAALGFHKQIVNRLTEPFAHINVVISATQMSNFYALRRHPDAQPEIKVLADAMWEAQEASTPKLLKYGQWHLPYIQPHEWCEYNDEASGTEILRQVSAARCARVSYMTFDGKPSILEDDVSLCEKLVGMIPLHASPFEHQAMPDHLVKNRRKGIFKFSKHEWANPDLHGNFTGWCQNRKMMDGECQ